MKPTDKKYKFIGSHYYGVPEKAVKALERIYQNRRPDCPKVKGKDKVND